MGVVEMRMLGSMSEMTSGEKIINENIKGRIGMTLIVNKMRVNKLRWFGHDIRREKAEEVKVVENIYWIDREEEEN